MLPTTQHSNQMLLQQKEHITREEHYKVIEACNQYYSEKIKEKQSKSGIFNKYEFLRDRDNFLLLTLWNMGARISDVRLIDMMTINTYTKDMRFLVNKLSKKDDDGNLIRPEYHQIFLEDSYIIAYQNYIRKWEKLGLKKHLFVSYNQLLNKSKYEQKPITTRQIEHIVKQFGDLAGIPGLHPHMYRHGIAIFMRDNQIPLEIISKHLGHKSLQTTIDFYAKIGHETVRQYVQSKTTIN